MLDEFKTWVGTIGGGLGAVSVVYTWLTSRSATNAAELQKHSELLTETTRRVDAIEGEMRHLPDKDTVHKMELAMAEIRGELGQMSASAQATQRTVQRIEAHLLDKEK
ncbi:hypothetical protein GGD81_001364 [Rhodobium orientis]|nr:DUF2730 family protein [Rhodobium orientis]MBB4302337.1 hypothetical protein [Rhodobium orientis]